jgi:hypothetical protein
MPESSDNEAAKPNPALQPLAGLVGTWKTTGTHQLIPGKTFHGVTSFSWIEGGAFLIVRSRIEEPEIPSGIAIFGTDDANGICTMLYFDERGISRRYEVSFLERGVAWARTARDISQRFELTLSADGRTMESRGEMSRNGGPWEQDLRLSYIRTD